MINGYSLILTVILICLVIIFLACLLHRSYTKKKLANKTVINSAKKIKCDCECDTFLVMDYGGINTILFTLETDWKRPWYSRLKMALDFIFKKDDLVFKNNVMINIKELEKTIKEIKKEIRI